MKNFDQILATLSEEEQATVLSYTIASLAVGGNVFAVMENLRHGDIGEAIGFGVFLAISMVWLAKPTWFHFVGRAMLKVIKWVTKDKGTKP